MTAAQASPLTVRDLLAILAECDPDAPVTLSLPALIDATDKQLLDDPDVAVDEYRYTPEVVAGYVTSAEIPYERLFDERGNTRPGIKPNCVTIQLYTDDVERVHQSRKRAIEDADEGSGLEPDPITADPESVVVDVRLPRALHATIRQLLRALNHTDQVRVEQACTHGLLTVSGALEMLAEDLGQVETRPGSWEGANMSQVLASHGYNA
ncbi:hypothetical protein [Xanthomonas hortorum]|uniref:hypothetical protein n=1 Tax=Xanthomonas hortorum TaxID=56454 RepID=UPI0032E87F75